MNSTDGIRAAVEAMSREMALLGKKDVAGEGADRDALRAAWTALVGELALGPAPEYRKCPYCGEVGMRAATRCGSCWKALVPPKGVEAGHPGVTT